MTPTIGRIVIYNSTKDEKEQMRLNGANIQNQLPAVVVAVWSDTCVNLKVITDGPKGTELWKTSALLGESEGNWNWPVKA